MLACDPYPGTRVVAAPAALDALATRFARALRFAPDEIFLPATRPDEVTLDPFEGIDGDPHAIVEPDSGWSAACCSWEVFDHSVAPLIDWPIPTTRPALGQGFVAAVPCKVVFDTEGVVIVTQSAHAHDLEDRLR